MNLIHRWQLSWIAFVLSKTEKKIGFLVRRDTLVRELDTEGVGCRKRGRVSRRKYQNTGPNRTMRIDGYDNLTLFALSSILVPIPSKRACCCKISTNSSIFTCDILTSSPLSENVEFPIS